MHRMGFWLKASLLAGVTPPSHAWSQAAHDAPGTRLHYRPLNGRSLRRIAAKKEHHGTGRFINPMAISRPGRFRQLLSWKLLHENPYKAYLKHQPFRTISVDWEAIQGHRGLSVTFLKHAGLFIKDGETAFLIDPVFSEISWFIKDFTPIENIEALPPPDHVLITHGHYDHLDTPSLSRLHPATPIVTPLGYGSLLEDLGMKNHHQMDWFDVFSTKKREIHLLPCNHWTMRNPFQGPNRSLWGSYLLRTAEGATLYISGDTAYFDGFRQLGSEHAIDLAIFNLGAYEPRWFMASSHASPDEVVRAFLELGAKKLMIVHWGTFRLGDEPVHFPPRALRKALEKAGALEKLVDLPHGKTCFLS